MNLFISEANSIEIKWQPHNLNNFQKTMKINNTRACMKMKLIFCNKVTCKVSIKIEIDLIGRTVMFILI